MKEPLWKCIVGGTVVGIISTTLVGAMAGFIIAFDHCAKSFCEMWFDNIKAGFALGCLLGPISGILTWCESTPLEKKEGE